MTKPIILLGATGFIGGVTARALANLGADVTLAARERDKLQALARELGFAAPVRVIAKSVQEEAGALLDGMGVVVNTIGPFRQSGAPVVNAAVERGVHYVDTSAEQAFLKEVVDRFDAAAREGGIAVLNAQGYQFAFGYCGAAILAEELGALRRVDIFSRNELKPSSGTVKSTLGVLTEPIYEFRDGAYRAMQARGGAARAQFPGESKAAYGFPYPSGESIFVPRNFPTVRDVNSYLVLPHALATLSSLSLFAAPLMRKFLRLPGMIDRLVRLSGRLLGEPDKAQEQAAPFTVLVRAWGARGMGYCRMDGRGIYPTTARIAAQVAVWLAQDRARARGVISTDRAFGSRALLDALAAYGVSYQVTV